MSAAATAWTGGALLLFASIYLGVGFTELVMLFPGAIETTKRTDFSVRFADPVRRAVAYFAVQSVLMVAGSLALTISEWDQGGYRWAPLVYLVMTVAATAFTVVFIVPVNKRLSEEIADDREFTGLLTRWVQLNIVRCGFWTVEWLAIALWFVALATKGRGG